MPDHIERRSPQRLTQAQWARKNPGLARHYTQDEWFAYIREQFETNPMFGALMLIIRDKKRGVL